MQQIKYCFSAILLFAFLFANAQTEDRSNSFSLVLTGGVQLASTTGGSVDFPLYAENFGGFAGLQLRYQFSQKYGTEFHFSKHFLAVDAEKAASALLNADSNAQSVSLSAGTMHIGQFGMGIYRHFAFNEKIGLLATARTGLSVLHTPTISADITTEPVSEFTYKSADNPALFFGLDIALLYQIIPQLNVELGIGYSFASHHLTITSNPEESISEKWKYAFFTPKIGISYTLF